MCSDDGFTSTGCTCFKGMHTYAVESYGRGIATSIVAKKSYGVAVFPMTVTMPS